MTSWTKLASAFVLGVAIAVGIIGKLSPNLFLRIPRHGFLLWVMTGNPLPPYFDIDPMKEEYFHKFVHDGDVIFGSMPKSGTVWVHNIIHLLKNNGDDNFDHLFMEHVGSQEFLLYPEHNLDIRLSEHLEKRQKVATRPVPALTHFSHYGPGSDIYGMNVTRHRKVKYIGTLRNPKEVVRSFYSFINKHNEEFRKMWGGYPPALGSQEEAVDFVIRRRERILGPALGWWRVRKEPNVLLVNFADLKVDHRGTVERIAKFLEIPLSEDLLQIVLEKSSFDYMKKRENEGVAVYGSLMGRPGGAKFQGASDHIHKGVSDGANDFFTPEMAERFEAAENDLFREYPDLLLWLRGGGNY